ncbi:Recombinase [Polystyrenella longa]|uniref:Recombinase n=1 Tax=Polystyrenella longa TaxID=2528007 RepID=A0A518CTD5_9PLAN|nr:recombinase family protein [Polystyrenella longa]QDU82483.1 Recombinase [Polystyrenella longa]
MKDFSNDSESNKSSKPNSSGPYLSKSERRKIEQGLPSEETRLAMARTYLDLQTQYWPELVEAGVLPQLTEANVKQLADEFKSAFITDSQPFPKPLSGKANCVYLRYSDENSNKRSLAQQLKNVLSRANSDRKFVSWNHICADAAISGTTPFRRDYRKLLNWITNNSDQIDRAYVDDLSRLNRNLAESVSLNQLAMDNDVSLIGVTDATDTSDPNLMMMSVFNSLQNEQFINSLRQKVERGMNDSFEQGGNLHPPSFGYKLVMLRDADGEPKLSRQGKPIKEKVINEDEAEWVRKIFDWFVCQNWSRQKIAKKLNTKEVGGKKTWDSRKVLQLLERSVYRGIECYRTSTQKKDRRSGKVKVIPKPESEWLKRDVPHLRITSDDLWNRAQIKLQITRSLYTKNRKPRGSRTTLSPTLLVRPVCGYCSARLLLAHSSKYQSLSCMNGREKKHDCQLSTHKSVRILNKAILSKLHQEIFTEEFLQAFFEQANRELEQLLNEPAEDLTPLKKRLEKLLKQEAKLTTLLTEEDDLNAILEALRTVQAEKGEIERRLSDAEKHSSTPPSPIDPQFAIECLRDIETLLKEDVSHAAPILETLTGPIRITQGEIVSGKRSAVWHAEFTINTTQFMVELSRARNYPTAGTWEFLNTRSWTISKAISTEVDLVSVHEKRALEFRRLHDKGMSVSSIAQKVRWNEEYVSELIRACQEDRKPDLITPFYRTDAASRPPKKSVLIKDDVLRLRGNKGMAFRKIASWLNANKSIKVSAQTVKRTWDAYARSEPEG